VVETGILAQDWMMCTLLLEITDC